ncbi:MAG: oligosaccharide flippase family protein [Terriglobia bacterium]
MRGASLMVMRTLVLYPIGVFGEICLARLLTPQDFGVYALASFMTVTLAGVLEVGLAASLIQRYEEPRDEEYQILFSLQILGITALTLIAFFLAPTLFPLFNLDVSIRWKLLVLLFCPWISSFATMSTVKLERELRYAVFAKIDILRGLSYVGTAVPLAFLGCKSWSFIGAITVSTMVKAWVSFREAPWPIRLRLDLKGMERTLHFGILYQLSTLTSLFRDHIAVVLGAPHFGTQAVGYLNWAKNTTYYTSQIFTQVVSRVAFPTLSRVQHDKQAMARMTELILKYINLFTLPVIIIFAALIPEFVTVVYTNKWTPAIPAFYAYSVRMIGSNFTTLIVSVLNASGTVKQSLRILIWWTLLDWGFALLFIPYAGFTGIALAYALSVIPVSIWLILALNRVVRIKLGPSFYQPLLLSLTAGAVVYLIKPLFTPSWGSVIGLSASGLFLFVSLLLLLEGQTILYECKVFTEIVLRRREALPSR